jgi:hypothetical protein
LGGLLPVALSSLMELPRRLRLIPPSPAELRLAKFIEDISRI